MAATKPATITLLHLSDLQFGKNHLFGRTDLPAPDGWYDSLFVRMKDDLESLERDGHKLAPDLVVLSGDIAEWGMKKEFDQALRFLEQLTEYLRIPRRRVILVPGNHDINRKACEAYFSDCESQEEQPTPPFWPKWREFVRFFDSYYGGPEVGPDGPAGPEAAKDAASAPQVPPGVRDLPKFTVDEPWTLFEIPELCVAVVGLNSTIAESHRDTDHYGALGEAQCRWFAGQLADYRQRGWLRIGVVHHNVRRGAVRDDENLRDLNLVEKYLGGTLNLLLHGHTHEGKRDHLPNGVLVLSTGSAAVQADQRPSEVPNQYQILRIGPDQVQRWTRGYDVRQQRWIADPRSSDSGNEWISSEKVDLQDISSTLAGGAKRATDGRAPGNRRKPREGEATRDEEDWDEALADWEDDFPGSRRRREIWPAPDSLLARIARVCQLRELQAEVTPLRAGDPAVAYLRVTVPDDFGVRQYPVGVCESGVSAEDLERFVQTVDTKYRAADARLRSYLVYGGARPAEEFVRQAKARGVLLQSFVEFQGLIDFRSYLARQQRELAKRDAVYPSALYVPQRLTYAVGFDQLAENAPAGFRPPPAPSDVTLAPQEVEDALAAVTEWLLDERGRFVLVLGDFGTGKTFLLRELTKRLTGVPGAPVPVLLELRQLQKCRTLPELLGQHFFRPDEDAVEMRKLQYMLERGRVALLFDGFDELAQRVTYDSAVEHFDALLSAAQGQAKLVVTSRTQHFLSDRQVKTAIAQRAQVSPTLRLARLRKFDESQVRRFLNNYVQDPTAAQQRFELIRHIKDLEGLSGTPRMLAFIAELPEEQLRAAKDRLGEITAAELYRQLIEHWLGYETERAQAKGGPPPLSPQERLLAVTEVALTIWPTSERTVNLEQLRQVVPRVFPRHAERQWDEASLVHAVGSGTLLVREEEQHGLFSFIHQSVLEWLVANRAADELKASGEPAPFTPNCLTVREVSPLMADFFCDLAALPLAGRWARAALAASQDGLEIAKKNAIRVLDQLANRQPAEPAQCRDSISESWTMAENWTATTRITLEAAGQNLRGQDFSGRDLTGANFEGADLTEARLVNADLTRAKLTRAVLVDADLTGARLTDGQLVAVNAARARLLGADLRGANLKGVILRRARLAGAKVDPGALRADTYGAALPEVIPQPVAESAASICYCAVMSHNGESLLTGHADGTVRLWDVATGQELRCFAGHSDSATSVTFSPDGQRLASGSRNGDVRLWDLATGQQRNCWREHLGAVWGVVFSQDGRQIASGGRDRTVRVWEVATGKRVRRWTGTSAAVRCFAFCSDGQRWATGTHDDTVRLWEVATGVELCRCAGHVSDVTCLAFSPNGRHLAGGGADNTVRLWEVATGQQLRCWTGHSARVTSVAFSAVGQRLATGSVDGSVRLWDVATGQELRSFSGEERVIWSVAFSPDGQRLASGSSDRTVRLWEVATGRELRRFTGHENFVASVAFSPDGSGIVNGGKGGALRLWDVETGTEQRCFVGHEAQAWSVAFSPTGRHLASGGADLSVRIWTVANGLEVQRLQGHSDAVLSVAFSPDSQRLASAGADRTIRLWTVATGRRLRHFEGHEDVVFSVAFSRNGKRLASGSADRTVRLWEVATGAQLHRCVGHENSVRSVSFSPDGQRLASASYDHTVRLWDVATGQERCRFVGHEGRVFSVAFSPDGQHLASGSADGTVRLWPEASSRELCRLVGHSGSVRSVAFSPDAQRLASGSADGTVRLWDVATARWLATLVLAPEGWVAFTPDGRYKLGGNPAGSFWFLSGLCRFEPGELDPYVPSIRRLAPDEPLLGVR